MPYQGPSVAGKLALSDMAASSSTSVVITDPSRVEAKRLLVVLTDGQKKITNLLSQLKTLKAKATASQSQERALDLVQCGETRRVMCMCVYFKYTNKRNGAIHI